MTTVSNSNLGLQPGLWRWAALGFASLAVMAAVATVIMPHSSGWVGVALLAGIGAVASILLFAIWPRSGAKSADARRIAEAAAAANVAWAVTSKDGLLLDCNDAYRQFAGAGATQLPPPPELTQPGEGSAAVLFRLAQAAQSGQAHEEPFAAAPGLEILAAVRPLSSGQVAWWFTPRLARIEASASAKAAPVQRARERELGVAELFRDAPMGIAVCDAEGHIGDANAPFKDFFGASSDKLMGMIDDADRARINDLLREACDGKSPSATAELRSRAQQDRMAQLFVRPLQGTKRAILFLVDVSEQKALETKFAQSQKMQAVGQLAGGVAHDFNNLLTVIMGNAEFLLMRHQVGDPSFKEINEIHQNALRAATLVGQLLAFSRKQTLQPRVVNLRDVIGELAIMLRRLVREGMELKLDHGVNLWTVHADEAQLSNAIINLVVNARDAMPEGGSVTIRTSNETVAQPVARGSAIMPAGDYVRIDVADTGTGIPRENLGKIFDPFFTTKPVGQGTGLGLATVYGIVKQSGGFISVDSELGKGATFTVFLPRFEGDAAVMAPEPERIPRDVTGQDTVLLVEDEEAVRSFAARALKLRGYSVLEAAGGEEALAIVRAASSPIHLLITDVVMPNMDGPTLVRNVRKLSPQTRIIYMSGYAEETFRRNDERAEDLHFLPKPFGLKQLAAKVKEVLSSEARPS